MRRTVKPAGAGVAAGAAVAAVVRVITGLLAGPGTLVRVAASVPTARGGGELGSRRGRRRRRSQQLPRCEQVGVGPHDVPVRGIPPGPLPGDLGVGGARPEVSSRDGPQGVAAADGNEVVGRRRRSRGRRQQSGAVGVVDGWGSRRDVARAGRRRGDGGPGPPGGAPLSSVDRRGEAGGRLGRRESRRQVGRGHAAARRGPRGPRRGRPDRIRRPTREPAAGPASRPRRPARRPGPCAPPAA